MQIVINITDDDVLCLENDLLDIDQWVQDAVKGKISKCKKRLIREWQPILFNDPSVITIPAKEKEFIDMVTKRPDYKNRVQREAILEAAFQKGLAARRASVDAALKASEV